MNFKIVLLSVLAAIFISAKLLAQSDSTLLIAPQDYELGGITISGTKYLDEDILRTYTGLVVGQKITIPSEEIGKSITALWKQGLFSNIEVKISKTIGSTIFLDFVLTERPRLSKWTYRGISKGDAEDLNKKLNLIKGKVFTENLKINGIQSIKDFYFEKGYTGITVICTEKKDSLLRNSIDLLFEVSKGKKVRIEDVFIEGNEHVSTSKLKHQMKNTKEKLRFRPLLYEDRAALKNFSAKHFFADLHHLTLPEFKERLSKRFRINIFSTSKYRKEDYDGDKEKVIEYYNNKGFRDAEIIADTTYKNLNGNIVIKMKVNEGLKYHYRNIYWKGNTKYTDKELSSVLNVKKGDVYDKADLDSKLNMSQNSIDISSLYMDDGYLFFQITPVEVLVENDSIDLEIRIYEGKQATINKVIIKGNDKTNEHVIRRELRTVPGQKFSRSDIIRSQREIATLGFFNQEKIGITPIPHPEDGTVDIEYNLEEKPSDQMELQAGYGGKAQGLIGTLGVNFTNFSVKNAAKSGAWSPVPSGDGQKLGIRFQSTGKQYQAVTLSFTEPWFGGKKPNSLSVAYFYTRFNAINVNYDSRQITNGVSVSVGKRLKWPDDYFSYIKGLNFENYKLVNQSTTNLPIANGSVNNFNFEQTIARTSVNQPLYPQSGSKVSLSLKLTPPYSMFNNLNYATATDAEKYKFIEYHRWRFTSEWFTPLDKSKKLILRTAAKFGFLGTYFAKTGSPPFERFQVGGDGITGYRQYGLEILAQRGYEVFTPARNASLFNKFTMEMRYPISLNPSSTIYAHAFAEGANAWTSFKNYDPFKLNRSAGLGLRVFLPMFGLLGFDYGIRFDNIYNADGTISQLGAGSRGAKLSDISKFSIVLGFEPE